LRKNKIQKIRKENMSNKIVGFFILSLVFSNVPANAYTIYGAGAKSCGTWTDVRKNKNSYSHVSWVLGFVSSYGYYGDKNLKEVDYQAMYSWMDNYCQASPLNRISDGAKKLVEALTIKE
jgi:hypothetical protein